MPLRRALRELEHELERGRVPEETPEPDVANSGLRAGGADGVPRGMAARRRCAAGARRGPAYDPAMTASMAATAASRERPVAAYAACRRLLRRHDPTYYLAVLRLPADLRPAVHALY